MCSEDLKPCPFCAGKAEVRDGTHSGSAIHVSCRCGVQLFGGRNHFGSEQEAARTWNRRVSTRSEEQERKAFEIFMRKHGFNDFIVDFGNYQNFTIHHAWLAWQARARQENNDE